MNRRPMIRDSVMRPLKTSFPLPIVYAQAQIDNTQIKLGATGAADDDIENLLSHLTRLTPDSALADKLNEGWKAWMEYRSKRPL
jgi:hypothetical protein